MRFKIIHAVFVRNYKSYTKLVLKGTKVVVKEAKRESKAGILILKQKRNIEDCGI